jgi:MFS family permease
VTWKARLRPHRILIALLLSMGLAAIDTTIVATAVPSIVRDLGGYGSFPWVFSAYLLTQAITIPLYGRLADLFGRKPVLLFGIGMFLIGSLLCGIAWSMSALIVFRGIQGLGADLYSLQERGKVQGYLSSVWGVTAVAGPVLGGALAEYGTWRWIFFINLPIGALAAWMLQRHLHESVVRRAHRIDYAGSVTLAAGLGLVIFALLRGGVGWARGSPSELITLGCGVALLAWFARIERRSPEPMVPAWVFLGGSLPPAASRHSASARCCSACRRTFHRLPRGAGVQPAGCRIDSGGDLDQLVLFCDWLQRGLLAGRVPQRRFARRGDLLRRHPIAHPPELRLLDPRYFRVLSRDRSGPGLCLYHRDCRCAVDRSVGTARRRDRCQHVHPIDR